jgi:hypothetical protein
MALDLVGLAKADSYTFKSDMLSIFGGNRLITVFSWLRAGRGSTTLRRSVAWMVRIRSSGVTA